jgi:uncharacterized protein (TIGR03083 family)
MSDSPWPTIHAERHALADDLGGLSDAQWRTQSMCGDWDVHHLLAHMLVTTTTTPPKFFAGLVGAGFSFEKMSHRAVDEASAGGPEATLAAFRANADSKKSPPGPVDSWLGETLIHGEDIRRPLGIVHTYPTDAVVRTLEFYKKSNLIVGAKKRIAGLTLRATDADWSHGSGLLVEGPAMSLLQAMTGRKQVFDDLTGDGVETLRGR